MLMIFAWCHLSATAYPDVEQALRHLDQPAYEAIMATTAGGCRDVRLNPTGPSVRPQVALATDQSYDVLVDDGSCLTFTLVHLPGFKEPAVTWSERTEGRCQEEQA